VTSAAPEVVPLGGLRRDTAIVTICTLLSRITGFGRVLATAAVLGTGLLGDVYQSANLLPNLLFELAAGGVLQAVLVPAFVAARREGGDPGLGEAAGATAGLLLVGLGMVTVVGMAAAPLISRVLVASEPSSAVAAQKLDVMVPMALVFIPQLLCYGIGMVVAAALAARGRFVSASLAPAVNNIIVIAACLAFRAARAGRVADLDLTRWEFVLIAGGTTLGVVAFSALPAVVLSLQGVRWRPSWAPLNRAVVSLRASFGWATLSVIGTLVPTAAALILGNGASGGVAIFVYAFAFYVLPHALTAVPIATTLTPRVAHRWQESDLAGIRGDLGAAIRVLAPLLCLASAGMIALAWPVARVAAFGQTASQGLAPIAHALVAFGPGLLGYGFAFVMMRLLFALDDVRAGALLTIVGAVVGVVTMLVLSHLFPGSERAAALAVGYGASQSAAAVLLTMRVHRLTSAVRPRVLVRALGTSLAAAASATLVMLWLQQRFQPTRRDGLVAIVAAGSTGVMLFAVILVALPGGLPLRLLLERREGRT
jgi:putative peptidoglycan lipid II flippase